MEQVDVTIVATVVFTLNLDFVFATILRFRFVELFAVRIPSVELGKKFLDFISCFVKVEKVIVFGKDAVDVDVFFVDAKAHACLLCFYAINIPN